MDYLSFSLSLITLGIAFLILRHFTGVRAPDAGADDAVNHVLDGLTDLKLLSPSGLRSVNQVLEWRTEARKVFARVVLTPFEFTMLKEDARRNSGILDPYDYDPVDPFFPTTRILLSAADRDGQSVQLAFSGLLVVAVQVVKGAAHPEEGKVCEIQFGWARGTLGLNSKPDLGAI